MKPIKVCKSCLQVPTGAKTKSKKCCSEYDTTKRVKREIVYDIDIVTDYTVASDK